MYAVIDVGGQQQKISQGDTIKVQKVVRDDQKEIALDNVLLVSRDDTIIVGQPYVENVSVKAEVLKTDKASKILVFKQKPRKGHRKLRGHRQAYTLVRITDIVFGG